MDSANIKTHKINISNDIKSTYILKQIFNIINKLRYYHIIKYNKNLQNKLNVGQKFIEELMKIEIEIIPKENEYVKFIKDDIRNTKIYFNNNYDEEIKKNRLCKDHKINKIKIIIDKDVKSLEDLFQYCYCIKKINFIQFYRNDIIDMSKMFDRCISLEEINLSNFNTKNVTNMSNMFCGCLSLKKINLSNFNTDNVTNMDSMFSCCSSLKKLNISNFNTDNVTEMSYMFDLCSDELKLKLQSQYKNFKNIAFEDKDIDLYSL